jgi:hypothetical protein
MQGGTKGHVERLSFISRERSRTMSNVSDTKVLLSFGAVQGGSEFAMQLRLDIYKKFGKSSDADPYFCYLDAESLRTYENTIYTYKPDTDMNVMSNPVWKKNYELAMRYSRTMLLLITKQWMTSRWCWLELDMLVTAAENSKKKIAVVYWPDAASLMKEGTWRERQEGGTTRTPKDLYERIQKIGSFVTTTCGAQAPIEGKLPGGSVNTFAYSCTEQECKHILGMIDA